MSTPASHESVKTDPVLPPQTVDWVFGRLAVRYGHFFLGRWQGIDLEQVKADWAYELRYLTDDQLQHGLDNLPAGNPPDVGQFRAICRSMPDPERLKLPAPPRKLQLSPQVAEALQALKQPHPDTELPNGVGWARRYVAAWGAAKNLTPFQKGTLAHAREVLRLRDPELQPTERTDAEH